jgi:hypothetical protein
LPGSIKKNTHQVRYGVGDAIQADAILIECRKPAEWDSNRGSKQHNSYTTTAKMNAYAVITKKFTNVRESVKP